jgi:hypothetical protein
MSVTLLIAGTPKCSPHMEISSREINLYYNIFTLYICSKKRFFIIEEFLYKHSTVWLTRKKEKCENIKNKLNSGSETIPRGSTLK